MNLLFAGASPTTWDVFIHFPIMMILVNLVFSATRYDDWRHIIRHARNGMFYIITFLLTIFLFIYLGLQIIVPWLFG